MGKIDKEKLLKELTDWHVPEQIINIVEAVPEDPEEPEIDFDALYNEWCKNTKDWSELRSPYDQARSLRDFLKSKNLTQPQVDMDALRNEIYASIQKPVEIPVKKTWTLKKEYEKYSRIIGHTPTTLIVDPTVAPDPEFYDYKEDPDYSKIPKGSIVEIECLGDKFYRTFVKFEHENIFTKDGEEIEQWSPDVIIRVVELAKE